MKKICSQPSKEEKNIYSTLRSFMKQGKAQRKVGREYINMIKENNLKRASEKRLDKVNKTVASLTQQR